MSRRRSIAPRRMRQPLALELRYLKLLERRAKLLFVHSVDALKPQLMRMKDDIDARADQRGDSAATDRDHLVRATRTVERTWYKTYPVNHTELEGIAASTDRFATAQVKTRLETVITIAPWTPGPAQAAATGFARANTGLITSIDKRHFDDLTKLWMRSLEGGRRTADIAKDLEGLYSLTEARARLIARDQIAKLNSNLNQMRQMEVGVSRYRWWTADDGRVRDGTNGPADHKALEGTIHAWTDPPFDGRENVHPGEAIQCRCTAEPIMSDVIDDPELLEAGGDLNNPLSQLDAYGWAEKLLGR